MHGAFEGTQGGRQSSSIHQGRQDKHVAGTKNHAREIASGRHPSVLTEDASALLRDGAGKGVIYGHKEVVDYGRVIGRYYDLSKKQYYDTTRATIHYDSKGNAHIVPALPTSLLRRSKK